MSAVTTEGTFFRKIIPYKNIFTPEVLGYYRNMEFVMELSEGVDMDHKPMWGVTVVNIYTKEHEHGRSKLFRKKKQAVEYMDRGIFNYEKG